MPKKFIPATEGCADCEYIAKETEGDITICPECSGEENDGQPDWQPGSHDPGESLAAPDLVQPHCPRNSQYGLDIRIKHSQHTLCPDIFA